MADPSNNATLINIGNKIATTYPSLASNFVDKDPENSIIELTISEVATL
jgi:ATP phosphoribosyltransferase